MKFVQAIRVLVVYLCLAALSQISQQARQTRPFDSCPAGCGDSLVLHLVFSKTCIQDLSTVGTDSSTVLQLITEPGQAWCGDAELSDTHLSDIEARNRLYSMALGLDCINCFLYIVFIDAEFGIEENLAFSNGVRTAWALFHDLLFSWEPAIAQPSTIDSESQSTEETGDSEELAKRRSMHQPEEVQVPLRVHHKVLAVHREAASFLLPYHVEAERKAEENESRDYPGSQLRSEQLFEIMALAAFHDHVLQFNTLRTQLAAGAVSLPPPTTETTKWAAESMRRLSDFLHLELVQRSCGRANERKPRKRAALSPNQYVIAGTEGIFDPCHEIVARRCERMWALGSAEGHYCWRRDSVMCAASPFRFEEKLLLFVQEMFVELDSLVAEHDGFQDRGCNPHTHQVRVQISHPVNSDVVRRSEGIKLHGVVAGLPRHHHFGMQLDGYALRLAPLDPQFTPLQSFYAHHIQGSPPVEWYCAPPGVVGVREFKWVVSPHEMLPAAEDMRMQFKAEVMKGPSPLSQEHILCINTSMGLFPRPGSCGRLVINPEIFDKYEVLPGVLPAWTSFLVDYTQKPASQQQQQQLQTASIQARNQSNFQQGAGSSAPAGSEPQWKEAEFLYLVQHDECIDLSHLESGRSHVVQLNWKKDPSSACPGNIYLPDSTLVQGRNALYQAALVRFRGHRFRYIVIMDGDATMVEVEDFGMNTGNAWHTFEDYLLEWEPAVGFPHFGSMDYNPEWEVQVAYNFDQIVVAYHADAAPLLLPYTEVFDNISWWYCASVQNALVAAVYNDHRLQFNAIRALSWNSNPSPKYKRASNFLHPLAWIAPAITSLDALMLIPFFSPWQQSTGPNRWNSLRKAWVMPGTPQVKGARSYQVTSESPLHFCHEYFVGRELFALCDPGRGAVPHSTTATRGQDIEAAVLRHLVELQVRISDVAAHISAQSGAHPSAADFEQNAARLSAQVARFECAVRVLRAASGQQRFAAQEQWTAASKPLVQPSTALTWEASSCGHADEKDKVLQRLKDAEHAIEVLEAQNAALELRLQMLEAKTNSSCVES